MLNQFVASALDEPLVVDDYVKRVPSYATIKGMFLSNLLDISKCVESPFEWKGVRFFAFRDYPLVEQVRLIPRIAVALYPDVSLRQSILQLGRLVCPAFARSMIGNVLFSAVESDVSTLMRVGSKAYSISSNVGRLEILESGRRSAYIRMRDMFNFVDCYQVGILEGALMMLGYQPKILLKLESLTSAEMQVTW